jgi:Rps23 Pro-64 3,4-dihydroxylase Tpa1-like proline 4-hydroxylase
MDGSIATLERPRTTDVLDYVPGWPPANQGGAPASDAIILLLRDGSRLRLRLANPLRQVQELAGALSPAMVRPETITLELEDGSRLMLPTADILGLRLPPERPAAAPAGDADVLQVGIHRLLRIRNFLAPAVADELYRFAIGKQAEFKSSSVLSNDPEYRKSVVLYGFPLYEAMFRNMMTATLPQVCDALGVARFQASSFECQMTATFDRGYFKAHCDNAQSVAHRQLTYVYYFHRQPRPFVGGDIRFFDHNPLTAEQPLVRHLTDLFHEVRDIVCQTPTFENSRFTVNGWLGLPRAK